VFCQLLDHAGDPDQGVFAIELDALARSEQHYIPGTAILITPGPVPTPTFSAGTVWTRACC
jgi:hypothetical protein